MELVLNDKTYVMPKVKTRMLRRAIEISESINFNNLIKRVLKNRILA